MARLSLRSKCHIPWYTLLFLKDDFLALLVCVDRFKVDFVLKLQFESDASSITSQSAKLLGNENTFQ